MIYRLNNSALCIQHSALFFSWGRGIEKITDACKAAGLLEPVIEENSGGVAVELVKANDVASGMSVRKRGRKRSSDYSGITLI
jgi:predicted HTH transcriptional regulator